MSMPDQPRACSTADQRASALAAQHLLINEAWHQGGRKVGSEHLDVLAHCHLASERVITQGALHCVRVSRARHGAGAAERQQQADADAR